MSKQARIEEDFRRPDLKKKSGTKSYLPEIRKAVSKNKGSQMKLKNVEKYSFKVGSLAETSYRDEPEMLEEWEQFYLADHTFMEVIGVLEKFPCNSPDDELVLMVCEDGKVFAYEGNRLHLVSDNLEDLFTSGLKFPGAKQYYRGQSFEDMKDEEWDEVRESEEVRKVRQEHQKMLKGMKDSYLKNLDVIMGRNQGKLCPPARGPEPVPVVP